VQHLPTFDDPDLLVGPEHFSDAGVYRIADGKALVQSVDFFPPLVDDAFIFGQIAAANAMGDVYAMGGRPLTVLNIVGFPDDKLPMEILRDILRGGAERVQAAGAVVVGGHSVRDTEIKYGLSVTGLVDPEVMMTNDAAKPGDVIVLTKALGTGFVTTAERAGKCPQEVLDAACRSMTTLNAAARDAAVDLGVRASTDVTGFGLAGHGTEMARASKVAIHVELNRLPVLPGAEALAARGFLTRANETTREYLRDTTRIDEGLDATRLGFVFDPQTSGGLLLAVEASKAEDLVDRCRHAGLESTAIIRSLHEKTSHDLLITA